MIDSPEAPEVGVPVEDLIRGARMRAEADHLDDADTEIATATLLELLAAALEAEREWVRELEGAVEAWSDAAMAEREARRKDRETVDAGLRRIGVAHWRTSDAERALNEAQRIARDLLERP